MASITAADVLAKKLIDWDVEVIFGKIAWTVASDTVRELV